MTALVERIVEKQFEKLENDFNGLPVRKKLLPTVLRGPVSIDESNELFDEHGIVEIRRRGGYHAIIFDPNRFSDSILALAFPPGTVSMRKTRLPSLARGILSSKLGSLAPKGPDYEVKLGGSAAALPGLARQIAAYRAGLKGNAASQKTRAELAGMRIRLGAAQIEQSVSRPLARVAPRFFVRGNAVYFKGDWRKMLGLLEPVLAAAKEASKQ